MIGTNGERKRESQRNPYQWHDLMIMISTAVTSMSYLDELMRWDVSCRTDAVLWATVSRIYSKMPATFLCSSHVAFTIGVSLESKWCNHTVVMTRLYLARIPVLFYQKERSDFHTIEN